MHEVWKWELLPHKIIKGLDGKTIEVSQSTTELSTVEMKEYLKQIRMKASEMGIPIPLPNEVMED